MAVVVAPAAVGARLMTGLVHTVPVVPLARPVVVPPVADVRAAALVPAVVAVGGPLVVAVDGPPAAVAVLALKPLLVNAAGTLM